MNRKPLKPVSWVMAGRILVASILRQGNGRPSAPVRFTPYWTPLAERLGAPPPRPFASRHEAEAFVMQWATPRLPVPPQVWRQPPP
jgi:hypothetical protein